MARNLYAQARARGKAAGIVRLEPARQLGPPAELAASTFSSSRTNSLDMETFKTEVHVPPGSSIEFELHYQEMMSRKLGIYEHRLQLQPGRLVPHFQVNVAPCTRLPPLAPADVSSPQVDVYIFEPSGISMVQTQHTLGNVFNDFISMTKTKNKVRLETSRRSRRCLPAGAELGVSDPPESLRSYEPG